MRTIEVNAENWKTILDFYHAIYAAIDAPKDASCNINALMDYMVWGDMGAMEPPYAIKIYGTARLSAQIVDGIVAVRDFLIESRNEYQKRKGRDVDVTMEIVS